MHLELSYRGWPVANILAMYLGVNLKAPYPMIPKKIPAICHYLER